MTTMSFARRGCSLRPMRAVAVIVGALAVVGSAPAALPGWERLSDAPEARTEVTAATVGTTVAVAGGFTGDGRATARVDAYDTRSDRWSRLPDLPVAVHHAMAASDGRRVYVVGGYLARSALTHATRRAFALRPGDRSWTELRRMPVSRAAGGAAVVGGRLYVVGGTYGVTPALARRSFVLNLATGRWSALPGVPQPREHLGAAALGGRVYVLGGRTAAERFRRADAWDVGLRRWVRLPDMPTARGGTAATARAGTVVSIGGESSAGTNREVESFDPATGRWRQLAPLPEGRHGLGVAAVGDRLYVLMGGPKPGLSVSSATFMLR
jgi:N-acetylneuraminic acid mutarotase